MSRSRSGATRETVRTFVVFVLVGVVSLVADAGSLWLLHGRWHVNLPLAAAAAFAVGFAVNFGLNRTRTFRAGGPIGPQLLRYSLLVAANLAATVLLVTGLDALGMEYLLAKVVTALALGIVNFVIYRHWVFVGR